VADAAVRAESKEESVEKSGAAVAYVFSML
jgi:hypothetical protein